MSSNINWKSNEAIALYVAGGLLVGFIAKEALSSKPVEPAIATEEPRDVTEELTGRPSETGTVDLNVGSSDNNPDWKTYEGDGGKKSRRKQRKNKSKKSRPKSKKMTKK
jgi:hypothetical protein